MENVKRIQAEDDAVATLATENLHRWQEIQALTRGDADQRQRWAECRLPERELLELARTELFRPFVLLSRRRKLGFASIKHPKTNRGVWSCLGPDPDWSTVTRDAEDLVEWSTAPQFILQPVEWQHLARVHEGADHVLRHPWLRRAGVAGAGPVRVEVREHRGLCRRCGEAVRDLGALVTVGWAGRTLSREYAL
jgi:hypothetical protein